MFLSQLVVNRTDREAMKALSDIYRLHKMVMAGFSTYSNVPRVLFRVEPEGRGPEVKILVQSSLLPSWKDATVDTKGFIDIRTKEFFPSFNAGSTYRFRMRANPVVTRDGKRLGLIRDESLVEWLTKKEMQMGARLRSVAVMDEGYITGRKIEGERRHNLSIKTARYEGMLEVVDPSAFSTAVSNGIGPAKGFGCGLLSLARA